MKRKILIIGGFPIEQAQHGGQKRARAFFDAYVAAGHNVRYVAVYSHGAYPVSGSSDIAVGPETERKIANMPELADYVVGMAIASDSRVRHRLEKLLKAFDPDIVQLEQAFPYAGLREIIADLHLRAKLVYSSQNIEHEMKRSILEQAGLLNPANIAALNDIAALEIEFSKRCDLLLAVSDSDLAAHQAMGASQCVLAPNGMTTDKPTARQIEHVRQMLSERQAEKLVLFVGSAHLPNWTGFEDLVGFGVGFLPYNIRLGIAGGISVQMVQRSSNTQDIKKISFWNRAIPFGRISDQELAALLYLADVVILPISSGGGSNLKTAEALLSQKPIVASSFAFRGFDAYRDFPNVHIADNPIDFRQAILDVVASGKPQLSDNQKLVISKVGWGACLENALTRVEKL